MFTSIYLLVHVNYCQLLIPCIICGGREVVCNAVHRIYCICSCAIFISPCWHFPRRILDPPRAAALQSRHVICRVFLVDSHSHLVNSHCHKIHRFDAETANKVLNGAYHRLCSIPCFLCTRIWRKAKPVWKSDRHGSHHKCFRQEQM